MSSKFRLIRRTDVPESHDAEKARSQLEARTIPETLHDFRKSAPYFKRSQPTRFTSQLPGTPLLPRQACYNIDVGTPFDNIFQRSKQ